MLNKVYEVISIYRNHGPLLSFSMVLQDKSVEFVRVDRSQSQDISQGSVYTHDFVKIKSITKEGIVFEVVDVKAESINESGENKDMVESIIYGEQSETHCLPFLCDVLPYSSSKIESQVATPIIVSGKFIGRYMINGLEIPNLKFPVPLQFVTRICYKTRINIYPNSYNPFFFVIASSNHTWIKIVFWKERLKEYSGLKVGDIIQVKEYRNKRKLPLIEKVEYNTFTESVYFECEEISAREIGKIEYKVPVVKTRMFDSVCGVITYMSVLKRYMCNGTLLEYVMCRIGEKCIVLFYNSDEDFRRLETGMNVEINEIRRIERCKVEYYVSTIYTQFCIVEDENEEIGEKAEMVVRKRKDGDGNENDCENNEELKDEKIVGINNLKKFKGKESESEESVDIKEDEEIKQEGDRTQNHSKDNSDERKKQSDKSPNYTEGNNDNESKKLTNETENYSKENKMFDNKRSDTSEIELLFSNSEETKLTLFKPSKRFVFENIFGGISFLPDFFEDIFAVTDYKSEELINGRSVPINLFMKPTVIGIEELDKISLVLNESKKHIVYDEIIDVVSDALSIGYFSHGVAKNQKSHKVLLASKFQCYFFQNFFVNTVTVDDIKKFIGVKTYVVIESFRVDQTTVLHYLTGIIEDKK